MTLSYREQLLSPQWQRKRLESLEACGWKCLHCGDTDTTLHVHHKRYVKGRMAWEYDASELVVLCDPCHKDEHHMLDELREFLAHVDTVDSLALLRGYFADARWFPPWIGSEAPDRNRRVYAIGLIAMLCNELSHQDLKAAFAVVAGFHKPDSRPAMLFHSYSCEFDFLG